MIQFPNKLKLNGADYFHLLLERLNRSNEGSNNVIRLKIEFNDVTEMEKLLESIRTSELVKWIANLELRKPVFSLPYWQERKNPRPITLIEHKPQEWEEVFSVPILLNNDDLIRFDTIKTETHRTLMFSFHHIIMDGRGAGILLQSLGSKSTFANIKDTDLFQKQRTKKSFFQQFIRMFSVKHFVEDMLKDSMQAPEIIYPKNNGFYHEIISFSKEETERIDARSRKAGALFGANLFQLACCFLTFSKVSNSKDKLWVPIPYDGRRRGNVGPILGNHISFLFYQISPKDNMNVNEVVIDLSRQMNQQLKEGIPEKYNDMLSVMRYFPISFYHWATTRSAKGRVSSFLYSSSGEGHWDTSYLNNSFKDLIIIPPYSSEPGLTFTFCRFNNHLKINIIACKKKFDQKRVTLIRETLTKQLFDDKQIEGN